MSTKNLKSNQSNNHAERVGVVVRCRPFSKNQSAVYPDPKDKKYRSLLVNSNLNASNTNSHTNGNLNANGSTNNSTESNLSKLNGPNIERFQFDRVFAGSSESNSASDFYQDSGCSQLVKRVLDGYNCTIFAYGQTSSGKTWTMVGDREAEQSQTQHWGVTPRACNQIFQEAFQKENLLLNQQNQDKNSQLSLSDVTIKCRYVELYMEEVRDLLSTTMEGTNSTTTNSINPFNLPLRELQSGEVYVQGAVTPICTSQQEIMKWFSLGTSRRVTSATQMNQRSSRSHAIFSIFVISKIEDRTSKQGKLHLVDLAGSERISKSGVEGKNLKETAMINLSLLTLGQVVSALSGKNNDSMTMQQSESITSSAFIPYRNSKLTRLLQDSLGGNAKTLLIATIHPSYEHVSESLQTLKYATRVGNIVNKPMVNENVKDKMIQDLKSEVAKLKAEIGRGSVRSDSTSKNNSNQNLAKVVISSDADIEQLPLVQMLRSEILELKRKVSASDSNIKVMEQKFEEELRKSISQARQKEKDETKIEIDKIHLSTTTEINKLREHQQKEIEEMKVQHNADIEEIQFELKESIKNQDLILTAGERKMKDLEGQISRKDEEIQNLENEKTKIKQVQLETVRGLENEILEMKGEYELTRRRLEIAEKNLADELQRSNMEFVDAVESTPIMQLDLSEDSKESLIAESMEMKNMKQQTAEVQQGLPVQVTQENSSDKDSDKNGNDKTVIEPLSISTRTVISHAVDQVESQKSKMPDTEQSQIEFSEIQNQNQSLTTENKQLQTEISNLKQNLQHWMASKTSERRKFAQQLQTERDTLSAAKKNWLNDKTQLIQEKDTLLKENDDLKLDLKYSKIDLEKERSMIQFHLSEIDDLKESIKSNREYTKEVTQKHVAMRAKDRQTINDLKDQIDNYSKERQRKVAQLESVAFELLELNKELEDTQHQNTKLKQDYDTIKDENSELLTALATQEQDREELRQLREKQLETQFNVEALGALNVVDSDELQQLRDGMIEQEGKNAELMCKFEDIVEICKKKGISIDIQQVMEKSRVEEWMVRNKKQQDRNNGSAGPGQQNDSTFNKNDFLENPYMVDEIVGIPQDFDDDDDDKFDHQYESINNLNRVPQRETQSQSLSKQSNASANKYQGEKQVNNFFSSGSQSLASVKKPMNPITNQNPPTTFTTMIRPVSMFPLLMVINSDSISPASSQKQSSLTTVTAISLDTGLKSSSLISCPIGSISPGGLGICQMLISQICEYKNNNKDHLNFNSQSNQIQNHTAVADQILHVETQLVDIVFKAQAQFDHLTFLAKEAMDTVMQQSGPASSSSQMLGQSSSVTGSKGLNKVFKSMTSTVSSALPVSVSPFKRQSTANTNSINNSASHSQSDLLDSTTIPAPDASLQELRALTKQLIEIRTQINLNILGPGSIPTVTTTTNTDYGNLRRRDDKIIKDSISLGKYLGIKLEVEKSVAGM